MTRQAQLRYELGELEVVKLMSFAFLRFTCALRLAGARRHVAGRATAERDHTGGAARMRWRGASPAVGNATGGNGCAAVGAQPCLTVGMGWAFLVRATPAPRAALPAGMLPEPPHAPPFNGGAERFEQRFDALSALPRPPPLTHADFVTTTDPSGAAPQQLLEIAGRVFAEVRSQWAVPSARLRAVRACQGRCGA
jgi:hypothetical protein